MHRAFLWSAGGGQPCWISAFTSANAGAVARIEAQAALRVVDVAGGRVVHRVARRRLAVDLLVVGLVVLGHGRELRLRGDERDEGRIEGAHVGLHDLGRVALRVDGDEQHLQLVAIGAELLLDLRHLGHGGGAHVGALGVAEEQHHDLALEVGQRTLLAVGVLQGEALGVVRTGHVDGVEAGLGV